MAVVTYHRFDVLLISLDPTQGHEIQKTRPCVVVSPDEMNKYVRTLIVAPMTSQVKRYPTRVMTTFANKEGEIVLDQIRTIDKSRVVKRLGKLDQKSALDVLETLVEIFS